MKLHTIRLAAVLISGVVTTACTRVAEVEPSEPLPQSKRVEPILVNRAPFGPQFTDDRQLIAALSNLQSPGFGYFMANQVGGHLDQTLDLVYVELPDGHLNRYFALEYKPDGAIRVVDDFVASKQPEITRVHRQPNGTLQYAQSNGTVVLPHRDP